MVNLTKGAIEMHQKIVEAVDKHEITREEYDEIINISLKDNFIDKYEKAMLSELQNLIEDKIIKIIKD